jgi:hypothetical protein
MTKRDEERAKRLGDALRLNLRRRKAQARGEREDAGASENSPSPSHPADAGRAPPSPVKGEG